jgi:hypothetical protein
LHFSQEVNTLYPLTDEVLSSRETLSRWLNEVHNSVNRRLNKREVSYEEASRFFNGTLNGSSSTEKVDQPIISTAGIVGIVIAAIVLLIAIILFINYLRLGTGRKKLEKRFLPTPEQSITV